MRRLPWLVVFAVAFSAAMPAAGQAPERRDYAAVAFNVLPPGQNGSLVFNRNTRDQARLYDCLTPLFDKVRAADLEKCFKRATLGLVGKAARVQRPRPGVVIERDRWGVPHVTGKTAADVAFGAGWATVEDRGLAARADSRPSPRGRPRHPRHQPGRARAQWEDARAQRPGRGAARPSRSSC